MRSALKEDRVRERGGREVGVVRGMARKWVGRGGIVGDVVVVVLAVVVVVVVMGCGCGADGLTPRQPHMVGNTSHVVNEPPSSFNLEHPYPNHAKHSHGLFSHLKDTHHAPHECPQLDNLPAKMGTLGCRRGCRFARGFPGSLILENISSGTTTTKRGSRGGRLEGQSQHHLSTISAPDEKRLWCLRTRWRGRGSYSRTGRGAFPQVQDWTCFSGESLFGFQ